MSFGKFIAGYVVTGLGVGTTVQFFAAKAGLNKGFKEYEDSKTKQEKK